ncbi:unnamed protein product [Peniophora sp. CBMAI 1063]|nr:unnamed protein product [Peniophora sp. CBMAI 1063]
MHGFRVAILGAGGTGKSALAIRFVFDEFVSRFDPTIEDTYRKLVSIDGETSMVDVLDTAGYGQFRASVKSYIAESHGLIVVFSLTDASSLRDVETLLQEIYDLRRNDAETPVVLVGTKVDLRDECDILDQTLATLSARWSVPMYKTSSLSNMHVNEPFANLSGCIIL